MKTFQRLREWLRVRRFRKQLKKKRDEQRLQNYLLESCVIWRRDGYAILSPPSSLFKWVCRERPQAREKFRFIKSFATCAAATRFMQQQIERDRRLKSLEELSALDQEIGLGY